MELKSISIHNLKKLLVINAILISVILGIAELGLRLSGNEPGRLMQGPDLIPIEELTEFKDHSADENGITIYSQEAKRYIETCINKGSILKSTDFQAIDLIANDYIELKNGSLHNEFSRFIDTIKNKNIDARTEVEKAYLDYCQSPINTDGFRSIEFCNFSTDKTKVLLLGDSFTFGYEASNFTSSFADQLSSKGYVIYNSGISATTPVQYLGVIKEYIAKIKPDVIVLAFCMENDELLFNRELKPFVPAFYITNVNILYSCPQGIYYPTAKESYENLLYYNGIPEQNSNWFNFICAKTVLTTRIWHQLVERGEIKGGKKREEDSMYSSTIMDPKSTNHCLKKIQYIADSFSTPMLIIPIPHSDAPNMRETKYEHTFEGFQVFYPNEIDSEDYGDLSHFNDQGHTKYAHFIDHLIDSLGVKQP